ncbi:MAG: hypothetical protein ACLFR7_11950, partial [Opitutales bacterium]
MRLPRQSSLPPLLRILLLTLTPLITLAAVSERKLDEAASLLLSNPLNDHRFYRLSPAGDKLALLRNEGPRRSLSVYDFATEEGHTLALDQTLTVHRYGWIDDESMLACYLNEGRYLWNA